MTELVPANPTDLKERPEWSSHLALDVAIGTSIDAILEAYDLQMHELAAIKQDPQFTSQVERMRKDLEKEGVSFRMKAQIQAEHYLQNSWDMVHDKDVDPKVRADLIKSTMRWAGYDAPQGAGAGGPGGGFSVVINLGNAEKGSTYEGELE
jgi:hypothetical protein